MLKLGKFGCHMTLCLAIANVDNLPTSRQLGLDEAWKDRSAQVDDK